MMNRRQALKTSALFTASAVFVADALRSVANAVSPANSPTPAAPTPAAPPATATAPTGPFTLPPLPYPAEALEPHIDAQTMMLHHDKHHQAYVNNLNNAVKDQPALQKMSVEDLLRKINDVPEAIRTAVRNNGGGHANHQMFWKLMKPAGKGGGGNPSGDLAGAIDKDFGGLDKLKTAFNEAGAKQFGSGWVFVAADPKEGNKLKVVSRPNQDSVLMDGMPALFGNDVWEHAYYLKYQNKRADYLAAWWNLLAWDVVAERYAGIKAGKAQL